MGKVKYSNEYLLDKLTWLLKKYGKIQTKLIDHEPNFPNRKAYIRAFGSIAKACEDAGADGVSLINTLLYLIDTVMHLTLL